MVRFGERKIAKEKFYATKKPAKIWDVTLRSLIDAPSPPSPLINFKKIFRPGHSYSRHPRLLNLGKSSSQDIFRSPQ